MSEQQRLRLSGWCSGITGDQCHVNPCRSDDCQCPRREFHIHPVPVVAATPAASRCESDADGTPRGDIRPGGYEARERQDGRWEVVGGARGKPAKIGGATSWLDQEGALAALKVANRRLVKAARRASRSLAAGQID